MNKFNVLRILKLLPENKWFSYVSIIDRGVGSFYRYEIYVKGIMHSGLINVHFSIIGINRNDCIIYNTNNPNLKK